MQILLAQREIRRPDHSRSPQSLGVVTFGVQALARSVRGNLLDGEDTELLNRMAFYARRIPIFLFVSISLASEDQQ